MMSELRVENWTMSVAGLGPDDPLPLFEFPWQNPPVIDPTGEVPAEIARQSQYGRRRGPLPYAMQDSYTRDRHPQDVKVAVLENEYLRAAFLLEFGGRLWSLQDKATGRELLATSHTLQPANLALRNAWFSGGVEWNVGIIGHSAFTMSPVFAARIDTRDGTPVLRLYEWERLRQIPFQIDAFLPDGSPVLFIRVRLINPNRDAVPICWWSNMAVPEAPGIRVVVPARSAFTFAKPGAGLTTIPTPLHLGSDYSYPLQVPRAGGYYFDIEPQRRHWITALDQNGRGVIQTSTARLSGRTLFTLGSGRGGTTWHEFLAPDGWTGEYDRYLEIESGLAQTHMEHIPMPPGSDWRWLEAYGLLAADPGRVHSADWDAAQSAVEESLAYLIPTAKMEEAERWSDEIIDTPPHRLMQSGAGWGALARREREMQAGEPPLPAGLLFDDSSLGRAETPWLELLQTGRFPETSVGETEPGFVVDAAWQQRLENAVARGTADHWSGWYHLGIMRLYHGQEEMARIAWERSLGHKVTPWALRGLAMLAARSKNPNAAFLYYKEAWRLAPESRPLAVEMGRFLVNAGMSEEWLALLPALDPTLRDDGRIRLLEAQAALATGDLGVVADFFNSGAVVADIREGEMALEHLWFEWQAQELVRSEKITAEAARQRVRQELVLPGEFDFNMFRSPEEQ